MENKYYLLSVKELCEENGEERLSRAVFDRVDKDRREKAARMRPGAGRAASLGAGLLLQLAIQETMQEGTDEKEYENRVTEGKRILPEGIGHIDVKKHGQAAEGNLDMYTVSQALKLLEKPLDLKFNYGRNGKPYLQDYPFYFNLSHSGEYVFCTISDWEVGVDIQQFRPVDEVRLARRFFTEEEQKALERCLDREEQRKLFYRLWTRKEAYGKLTGEGIAATMGRSVLPAGEWQTSDRALHAQQRAENSMAEEARKVSLFWREWTLGEYRATLCQYKV